jgi:hypothetical protein
MIKRLLLFSPWALIGMLTLFSGCASPTATNDGLTDPPYPRAKSVIPLSPGNRWTFLHTAFDTGGLTNPVQGDISLALSRVYGLQNDTLLVPIHPNIGTLKFTEYVFEHEWNELKEGLLISYRDKNIDTSGVYIRGLYAGENRTLYRKPLLWLAYPAKPHTQWTVKNASSSDTATSLFEIIDTCATLSIPETQHPNMVCTKFVTCYLYRETKGSVTNYLYFSRNIGSVAYISYHGGILRRSYLIKNYYVQ